MTRERAQKNMPRQYYSSGVGWIALSSDSGQVQFAGYVVAGHRLTDADVLCCALMTGQIEVPAGFRRCFSGEEAQHRSLVFCLQFLRDRC